MCEGLEPAAGQCVGDAFACIGRKLPGVLHEAYLQELRDRHVGGDEAARKGLEQGARAIGTEAPGALGELDAARVPDHAREGLEKRGLSCADHARYKIDRRRGEREGEVDDGGNALIGDTEVGKAKLLEGV